MESAVVSLGDSFHAEGSSGLGFYFMPRSTDSIHPTRVCYTPGQFLACFAKSRCWMGAWVNEKPRLVRGATVCLHESVAFCEEQVLLQRRAQVALSFGRKVIPDTANVTKCSAGC